MVKYGDLLDRIQITTGTIENEDLKTWPHIGGGGGCAPEYFYVPKNDFIDGTRVFVAGCNLV
jgi:hypothetical protein